MSTHSSHDRRESLKNDRDTYSTCTDESLQASKRKFLQTQSIFAGALTCDLYRNAQLPKALLDKRLRRQAYQIAQQGNYIEAIQILNRLIACHPANATDYNNRGLFHFQNGQFGQALEDYNHAIRLNPQLASAYNNRANCYASQKQLAAAIADYEMAIDLNPFHARARINKGIVLRDLRLYSAALETFDIALYFNQLNEHVYAERGRTYHLLGDWNGAIADYHRALDCLDDFEQPLSSEANRLRANIRRWLDELLGPLHRQ